MDILKGKVASRDRLDQRHRSRVCARAFAGAGANIVLNGIGAPADVEKTRTAIERDFGVEAIYSPANMAEPTAVADMIRLLRGRLAAWTCSSTMQASSMSRRSRSFRSKNGTQSSQSTYPPHSIDPCRYSRHQTTRLGPILNTASAHSLVASPFKSAYVAAKHGIAGITKTVALELARSKITCNCISPGYVWTPLVEKQIPKR